MVRRGSGQGTTMRGLVGLTCLCWLLASVDPTVQILTSGAGHSYTYEVQSLVVSGIEDLASQYSGFELEYDLHVDVVSPDKAVFWIRDVRMGKLNDEVPVSSIEDIEIQHTPAPHYEQELSKPLIVYFDEHQVVKIEAAKSDPAWSVNMKKAIVEKFQLDLKPQAQNPHPSSPNQVPRIDPTSSVYTIYETGIAGDCETRYSILSVPSLDHPYQSQDVLNVTKVKNHRNCRSRAIQETDNFESQGSSTPCEPRYSPQSQKPNPIWRESSSVYESGCHFGFEPDQHPVKSYSISWYNISGSSHAPLIEEIEAKSQDVYTLHGKPIQVQAYLNITLVKRRGLRSQPPKLSNPVKYDSLEYQFPEEEYLDNDESSWYAVLGPVHVPEIKQAVMRMLEDLVNAIIPSEPETSKTAGANVIQIVNALDVLKRPELEELYQELESDKIQKAPRKQELMRKVFLDLLAISASDECALFARDLIASKRLSTAEAAEVVEGIGKNSDEPSDEVIQAYLALLERPRVQQSRRLMPAVGIALGKMIQDSCVEEEDPKAPQQYQQAQVRPRHPRSTRREESSSEEDQPQRRRKPQPQQSQDEDECSPQELQEYIQKIVQLLRSAKSYNKIQVYLETLAHIGSPKVLPYIKPYVQGEAPNAQALGDEDTDFLATNAIYALHHIAEDYPEEVLPIVTPIYFDPSEDYDQRIAAFSVLMASDPPLTLLQRVAVELHDEINNQVGSYVYSLLQDVANSTLPIDRKMAQKAQLVLPHAPDFDIGVQYSNTYQYTQYDDDDDYGLAAVHEWIASNISTYPRAFHTAVDILQAPFLDSFLEVGGVMKGIDELVEKLVEPSGVLSQILSRFGSNVQIRNVPQVLDIVKNRLLFSNQDSDTPRAALYYKLFGRTSYLTLDEQYVVELLEYVVESVRKMDTTSGLSASYVKIWMPASFQRAVPSTIGLPVVLSQRRPIILYLAINNARLSSNPQKQAPLNTPFAVSADIDVSLHMDSVALAYVVDPASDQIHGAAFEKTTEIALAKTIELVLDPQKDAYALSLKPKMPQEVFYHNSRPITFIGEASLIRQPKEEWLGDANEIETIPEPFKFDVRKEARPLGVSLRVTGDSESPWADIPLWLSDTADEDGIVAAFIEMAVNPEMINRELHVYLEPHRKSPASEIVLTADYDQVLKVGLPQPESQEQNEESSEEEEYEKAVSSIYGRSYAVPNAASTIQKLVKKTQATWAPVLGQGYSDPVPATVTHALDLTMAVKGQRTKHSALRLLYAHSLGFRSNWFQAVAHSSGDEHERPWQVCGSLVAVYPEMPNPFYLQMNTLKSQKAKFEGEVGWGSDCQSQSQIRIEGVMKKSEEQLTSSSGMYETERDQQSLAWYYKQCQVDRTEGQTQSEACQQAIAADSQFNDIELDIIFNQVPPAMLNVTHKLDLLSKYLWYPNMEANSFVSNPEDRVSIALRYSEQSPDIDLCDVEIDKPTERVVFKKLYVPFYEPPSTLDSYEEVFMDQFFDDDYYPECNLMEDFVSTFDNVTIELPDNKCQYILAHDSSPDKAYTIIASQIDFQAKTKALSMALAGHSIKLLPPRGESVPVVLNGKEQSVTPSRPIVLDFDKETEVRIYTRLTSGPTETAILVVRVPDDDITVKYDGKNALIKLPRAFQGDQVGLCGDFNDETFQEFTGPQGCVYVEEEDFANSYAIPGQSCPQPPKPQGPAFCPPGIKAPERKHSQEDEESKEAPPRPPRRQPQPESDEDEYEPRGKSHHEKPKHPHHEDKHKPRPQPIARPWSGDSDEDDKPAGHPDCIKEYTHTFEDEEGKTCFATQPVYKCLPECRPVRPKHKQVPYHCMPPSQYEKILKQQARHGVVSAVQNKPADKSWPLEIPEKCL